MLVPDRGRTEDFVLKGKIVHVDELKAVLVCVAAVVSCARTICKTRVIWIILNFRASLGFVARVLNCLKVNCRQAS